MREYDLFIDGTHVPASRSYTSITRDPLTDAAVSEVARASDRDARRAVEAARRAADDSGWSDVPLTERGARLRGVVDLLFERQAEIADLDVAEAGVPIRMSLELAGGALASARDEIDLATTDYVRQDDPAPLARPYGVAAIAPAYDAPFARAVAAIVPALLAGYTVVV